MVSPDLSMVSPAGSSINQQVNFFKKPLNTPSNPLNTPRFGWISDDANRVAKIIVVIALAAIAATGIGLMAEFTFFAVGGLILIAEPFLMMIGIVFNEIIKCIWHKSLITID